MASSPRRTYAYGDGPSQFGELTLPDGDGPHRVAVLLHGGFWRDRWDLGLMRPLVPDLLAHGWATWNVEYRRLGSGGGVPATLDDVAAAIDRLPELPDLDLSRVVAIGHSAGGHLAAWAATRVEPAVPLSGFVSQAGVLDLREAFDHALSRGVVRELLGGSPDEQPRRCALASPIERLPLEVPGLLTHGADDLTVPVEISRRFAAAAGPIVELVIEPNADHDDHLDPAHPLWRAVIERLD